VGVLDGDELITIIILSSFSVVRASVDVLANRYGSKEARQENCSPVSSVSEGRLEGTATRREGLLSFQTFDFFALFPGDWRGIGRFAACFWDIIALK
jgi:hypothetical protein